MGNANKPVSPAFSGDLEVLEQRRVILGVRRENPTGVVVSEEVKLHPINNLGEEEEEDDEDETRVRFSMFITAMKKQKTILVEKVRQI